MKRLLLILTAVISGFFLASSSANADVECQPIYGGGQTCISGNLVINKTVQKPNTTDFVDNLGVNDPKFSPEQIVTFRITLTNNGNNKISHIDVADIFPHFVAFNSGEGSFDANTKTLTFSIDNLSPDESKTFTITGKIKKAQDLPGDQSTICVVNQATATTNDGRAGQDTAQFCIQKEVLIAKAGFPVFPPQKVIITPPTGAESSILLLLLPTGLVGFLLRKKSHTIKKSDTIQDNLIQERR